MNSRKITNYMAETVAARMVEATLHDRTKAHAARGHELAEKVYLSKMPKAQREMVEALPAHYFWQRTGLSCNANGCYVNLNLAESRRFPNHLTGRIDLSGKLGDDVLAWAEAEAYLRKERKALLAEVQSAVIQTGTTKRLAETWPEAAAHLPAQAIPLPAVQIDTVRAKLARAA